MPRIADPDHYAYAPYRGRPRIRWPGNARIAFWVIPNIEHYELDPPPSNGRPAWPRPAPDVLNYSHRDYGNRIGFWRLAETLTRHGMRGSVSLNVAVCDHYPEIIERCCELGWELFSHGVYNTRFFYGMPEEEQRRVIREVAERIQRASGQRLDGWLTPAITNSVDTQHLLAEEGVTYTLDFVHDDQPMPVKTRSGKLISLPYGMDVNDVPFFLYRNLSPRRYVEVAKAQFDQLYAEGAESGTVMCLPIHPYVLGQPHRIGALDEVLRHVASHAGVWLPTGREMAQWYLDHHYDEMAAWIAAGTPELQA